MKYKLAAIYFATCVAGALVAFAAKGDLSTFIALTIPQLVGITIALRATP